MRKYCAESYDNGVFFDHTYDADNLIQAMQIADDQGWRFLGVYIDELAAQESAVMEKVFTNPVIH